MVSLTREGALCRRLTFVAGVAVALLGCQRAVPEAMPRARSASAPPAASSTASSVAGSQPTPTAAGPSPVAMRPCAPHRPLTRDERDGVDQRVRSFIADHERWWKTWGRGDPSDEGRRAAEELRSKHFVTGSDEQLTHWSSHPPHATGREALERIRRDDEGRLVVESTMAARLSPTHYEYTLARRDGEWRIVFIDSFVHERDERSRDMEPGPEADIATRYVDPAGYFAAIFEEGRALRSGGRSEAVRVHSLGTLELPSGRLGVADPYGASFGIRPLRRRVAPGRYLVQTVGDDTAAMRVLFRPGVSASTYQLVEGGVSVDAGTAAVFDAEAMLALPARARDRVASRLLRDEVYAGVTALRCGGPATMAFAPSGTGDGGYPVIWALGADGEPVALIIDFLLYAKDRTYEVTRAVGPALPLGLLLDRRLAELGKRVSIARKGSALVVTHDPELRVRLTRNGKNVAGRLSMKTAGDRRITTLHDAYGKTPPVDLTVSVFLGLELDAP